MGITSSQHNLSTLLGQPLVTDLLLEQGPFPGSGYLKLNILFFIPFHFWLCAPVEKCLLETQRDPQVLNPSPRNAPWHPSLAGSTQGLENELR